MRESMRRGCTRYEEVYFDGIMSVSIGLDVNVVVLYVRAMATDQVFYGENDPLPLCQQLRGSEFSDSDAVTIVLHHWGVIGEREERAGILNLNLPPQVAVCIRNYVIQHMLPDLLN